MKRIILIILAILLFAFSVEARQIAVSLNWFYDPANVPAGYTVDQAYLQVQKMKVNDEKMKTGLELQVASARSDFNNAFLIFMNKKKGLEVSTKIYVKTISKYKEGVAGSTDLNQKYNQFLQSESDYLQSMFTVINLRVQLNKLLEKS